MTAPVARAAKPPAAGSIVVDAASGRVLLEDHAGHQGPPASMTKLMTFLVVHDALRAGRLQLSTPVPITRDDAGLGGTQVYLDPRETFSVEDLLYALLIQSANDAAHALARAASTDGTVPTFVAAMNARAQSLGMTHTTWRTPHGLPPASRRIQEGDLSTPADMALLARELLLHTDVLRYTSVRIRNFGEGVRREAFQMVNHNHLLGRVVGVDGLKTGYTAAAGSCLTATAQRGERRVIVVAMGCPDAKTRNLHVTGLIDQGFAALPADARFAPAADAGAVSPVITRAPEPFIGRAPLAAEEKAAAQPSSDSDPELESEAAADDSPPPIRIVIPKG